MFFIICGKSFLILIEYDNFGLFNMWYCVCLIVEGVFVCDEVVWFVVFR